MARYLISEAARQTGVEAHVLRFWEEELELEIPRNDQGHRYYTEEHVAIFNLVKEMKTQGFQLKAIKDSLARRESAAAEAVVQNTVLQNAVLQEGYAEEKNGVQSRSVRKKGTSLSHQDKMVEFESIIYDIVAEALRNNNDRLSKEVSERVNDKVVKEMNYLMRENEEHLEAHFRKLDEELARKRKKSKQEREVAATKVTKLPIVSQTKKKRHLFPRKRKTTIY